jgi:P27 family predicted phage terminase small subunit
LTRARKPAEHHALQGTVPDYVPDSQHVGALPRPPKFLSKEAKKKFRAQARQLADRRTVTAGDADLLAIYAQTWERWVAACEKVRTEGTVCKYTRLDADGHSHQVEKVNVAFPVIEKSERAMLAILTRLGLTPKDRDAVRPTSPASNKNSDGQEPIFI